MTASTLLESDEHEEVHATTATPTEQSGISLPNWVNERRPTWGEKLAVPEWEQDDGTYRSKHGWKVRTKGI